MIGAVWPCVWCGDPNVVALAAAGNAENTGWCRFIVRYEQANLRVLRVCTKVQHSGVEQAWPNGTPIAAFTELCRA